MTGMHKKIIIAITGASGSIYARILMESVLRHDSIKEIAVIFSSNGKAVAEYENAEISLADRRVRVFGNDDMFAAPASGSAGYDAMVIVPCSMGTTGRIAAGTSGDLISRAADVMLKERRRLIVVPRETPLSTIHLRNMATLSECGAVILPASPSFYSRPVNIEQLCGTVVERIMMLLGFDSPKYEWGAETRKDESL